MVLDILNRNPWQYWGYMGCGGMIVLMIWGGLGQKGAHVGTEKQTGKQHQCTFLRFHRLQPQTFAICWFSKRNIVRVIGFVFTAQNQMANKVKS